MKTVRAHLREVHKVTSDDVSNLSEAHARLAGFALKCAKALRDGNSAGSASALEDFAREFSARAATEQRLAKFLSDLSDELGDVDQDLAIHDETTQPRSGLVNNGDNGDNGKVAKLAPDADRGRIRPDGVHGIIPTAPQVRLIPRAGQPAPETEVAPEFAHLVKTNEEL